MTGSVMTYQATASTAQDSTAQDSTAPNPQNPVYRLDADIQRAVRSSAVQASPALRQLSRDFNWWGGDGVVFYTLLVLIAGRVFKRRGMAEFGLRGAEGSRCRVRLVRSSKGSPGVRAPLYCPALRGIGPFCTAGLTRTTSRCHRATRLPRSALPQPYVSPCWRVSRQFCGGPAPRSISRPLF